ncbi:MULTISPECIES: hypothetical protein [Streptomyces]|uniref:HEPN domain-containing protein n=1 Tax=Streptomyces lycii TaxID=2654337 RepID=A0ABQ7FBK0_9ACTN|nr:MULTISPECIES: hypothetical protein [Streptomyces]KAF4405358.1 hypothetical protein GCU69_30295 [Streptomyces lycii]
MSDLPHEHHYACAAERHFTDADFLREDGRLPSADYHFGFAVECALKSLMLRFLGATMGPKPPKGRLPKAPWILDAGTGKPREFGHLPWLETDLQLLASGRSGARLTAVLDGLSAFDSWSVHERYRDGSATEAAAVHSRRTVAQEIIEAHQSALLDGRL